MKIVIEKQKHMLVNNNDPFWQNSHCSNGYLHRYNLLRQWDNCVEEVCNICGDQQFFKIVDGRIDNLEYITYHMRQVLPQQHNLFSHEYQDR